MSRSQTLAGALAESKLLRLLLAALVCAGLLLSIPAAAQAQTLPDEAPTVEVGQSVLCAPGEICECMGPGGGFILDCLAELCVDFPFLSFCAGDNPAPGLPPDLPPDPLPDPPPPPDVPPTLPPIPDLPPDPLPPSAVVECLKTRDCLPPIWP